MKNRVWAFAIPAVILLAAFLVPSLLTSQSEVTDKPSKEEVAHKMQSIQIPFVANNGQVDKQVKYYANTFGGTVFVTKNGEIVYSLPGNSSELGVESLESDGRRQRTEARIQECRGELHSPSGISPLERGDKGVCNTTPISNGMNETHPRPLLLEGRSGVALKEELVGAKVKTIQGEEKSVTKVSYFKGKDTSQWKTNISTYDIVSLGDVYDGIELKLKAYGNNVEKLFCVKSGANPEQIKISLSGIQPPENPPPTPASGGQLSVPLSEGDKGGGDGINNSSYKGRAAAKSPLDFVVSAQSNEKGARGLWVNEHGELVAETELGPVKFTKPIAYQKINGKRVDVSVKYRVESTEAENKSSKHKTCNSKRMSTNPKSSIQNIEGEVSNPKSKIANHKLEYGFKVASYDKTKDLIIDPLLASTFLGGTGSDYGDSLALDTSGNVYVTGLTSSTDFPTTIGAYNNTSSGYGFVSKLDSGLTSLLASTFLGEGAANSIALDTSGNVYVTGYTASPDFPTISDAYDTSFNGSYDGFVSKLNGELTNLLASTYLGGSDEDRGNSLTLDTSGNVYVTGQTYSTDFPTTSRAYDTSRNDYGYGSYDGFVSKLNSGLTNLLTSTYLGGSSNDHANSLALDTSGNVYVTGGTASSDFPTTSGAYDTSNNGSDVFVSKLDGGLTSLLASTFLGGSGDDSGRSLALDTSGNVYVTGNAGSGFPTTSGAYDTSYNGGNNYGGDVFVSKLTGGLTNLLASTYLGGASGESGNSLALDTSGYVYVTGSTLSTDFPTTSGAYDTSNDLDAWYVFVSKLDSGLTSLLASTYLGGSNYDYGESLALDTSGNVYVTGSTSSTDFPTTSGAYDTSYDYSSDNNDREAFVSKLDGNLSASTGEPTPSPAPTLPPLPTPKVSPSPSSEGIVFGIVNDEGDNPLKDVTVTITGNNISNNTTTDDDGYYEFTGLAAGSYTLTYEMEDYKAQSQEISLEAGETKELEVVTMEEVVMGTIYGYVVNIRGNPIEDARVRLKGVRTKVSKSTASDADGFFEFTDLGADTYLLFAKKKQYKKAKVTVKLKEGEDKEVEIEMKKTSKRIIKASVR